MSYAFGLFDADITRDACAALPGYAGTVCVRCNAGGAASGMPSVMEGVILVITSALEEYDKTFYRG